MLLDTQSLPPGAGYKLLTNLVVPRPIGWITSRNPAGVVNLAPFSFFNAIGNNPLLVIAGIGDESPQIAKHTARNITASKDFVVNLVTEELIDAMNVSAADFPEGESELSAAKLDPAPSIQVRTPRIAQAKAALECTLHSQQRIGANTLTVGIVTAFYIDDALVDDRYHIHGFAPIGRLGSPSQYCRTTDRFDLPRMTYAQWRGQKRD